MSDSVMKKAPNFFRPNNLRKAGTTFRQPIAIAALAAIGVHGLLWFGLPLLSPTPKPPDDKRSVRVVELSPLEQSRLPKPDLSSTLAPFPQTTLPKTADPAASATSSSPPSVADALPSYNIPGLSSSPSSEPEPALVRKKAPAKPKSDENAGKKSESKDESKSQQSESPGADGLRQPDGSFPSKKIGDDAAKKLQEKYAYSATDTSIQDWQNKSSSVSETINERYSIRDLTGKPIKLSLPYPKAACPFKAEVEKKIGPIGFTLVTRPGTGEVMDKWLTRSSGFKGVDEAAIKFLEDAVPKTLTEKWKELGDGDKPQKPQAYSVEMNIIPAAETCTESTS